MTFKAATEQNPRQTLANVPTYLFSFTAFKVSTSTLKIHTLNLNQWLPEIQWIFIESQGLSLIH